MTETEAVVAITVAALGAAGLVLGAVLPVLVSTRRRAKEATEAGVAAKEAVTNGHPEHIRDMLDRFHRENRESIAAVATELGGVKSDIRGVRRDVGRVADRQDYQERRVRLLEVRDRRRGESEVEVVE